MSASPFRAREAMLALAALEVGRRGTQADPEFLMQMMDNARALSEWPNRGTRFSTRGVRMADTMGACSSDVPSEASEGRSAEIGIAAGKVGSSVLPALPDRGQRR